MYKICENSHYDLFEANGILYKVLDCLVIMNDLQIIVRNISDIL